MGSWSACMYICVVSILLPDLGSSAPAQGRLTSHMLTPKRVSKEDLKLQVSYNGHKLFNGSDITPSTASEPPKVEFEGSETYTLMLIDPDVPSPKKPVNRNFIHWLVTNIPKNTVSKGQIVLEYMPPAPPPGTGHHRYIFKLYGQSENTIQVKTPDSRAKFSPEDFADQYDLGDPMAIFLFKAEHEQTIEDAQLLIPALEK